MCTVSVCHHIRQVLHKLRVLRRLVRDTHLHKPRSTRVLWLVGQTHYPCARRKHATLYVIVFDDTGWSCPALNMDCYMFLGQPSRILFDWAAIQFAPNVNRRSFSLV